MLIGTSFTIVKIPETTKMSFRRRMDKYSTESYSAIERNKLSTHEKTW